MSPVKKKSKRNSTMDTERIVENTEQNADEMKKTEAIDDEIIKIKCRDILNEKELSRCITDELPIELYAGNVLWVISGNSIANYLKISCNAGSTSPLWSIDAVFEFTPIGEAQRPKTIVKRRFKRNATIENVVVNGLNLPTPCSSVQVKINIINMLKMNISPQLDVIGRSNVVFLVGGHYFKANKELLSTHSPVFNAMFNGDFEEKNKKVIEIKDVQMLDFADFLRIIYNRNLVDKKLESIQGVLSVADRFQVAFIKDICEKVLIISVLSDGVGLDRLQVMLIADMYKMNDLQCVYLKELKKTQKISDVKKEKIYFDLSDECKLAILETFTD